MDPGESEITFPLQFLTKEIIQVIIEQADDFSSVIGLYNVSRTTQELLRSRKDQPDSRQMLVSDPMQYEFLATQTKLLEFLNSKFKLEVRAPITYLKLVRAYKHSALNPTCYNHISIHAALVSAAKYGLTEQLMPTKDGSNLYDMCVKQRGFVSDPEPRSTFVCPIDVTCACNRCLTETDSWRRTLLTELAITAYEHRQLATGDALWAALTTFTQADDGYFEELAYVRYDVWTKHLLRPYKLKSNRDIRQKHAVKLFDLDVPDAEKRIIWASQYATNALSAVTEYVKTNDLDPMFVTIVIAKLGLLGVVPDLDELDTRMVLTFAYSEDFDLQTQSESFANNIGMIKACKRGYFEWIQEYGFENEDFGFNYFGRGRGLLEFLSNWHLDHVVQLTQSICRQNAADFTLEFLLGLLLERIAQAGVAKLYFQHTAKYPLPPEMLGEIRGVAEYTVQNVDILNDIFARMVDTSTVDEINNSEPDSSANYMEFRLLVGIWLTYGRRQFEDSLMYLTAKMKVKFNLTLSSVVNNLLNMCVEFNAVGLLAYLFGYRLGNFYPATMEYELQPITDGLIILPMSTLVNYWQRSHQFITDELNIRAVILTLLKLGANP